LRRERRPKCAIILLDKNKYWGLFSVRGIHCIHDWLGVMVRAAFVAGAIAAVSAPAIALEPSKPIGDLIHESWSVDSGLPQGTIRAIAQTTDGYIWLGTHEGLARFDGREFTVFNEANTPLLRGSGVVALLQSRDGGLYIGLRDRGVVRYFAGKFSAVDLGAESAEAGVSVLAEDMTGALWVGTSGRGAVRVPPAAANGTRPPLRPFRQKDGLPNDNVTAIRIAASGDVWIGTFNGLVLVRGENIVLNPTGNKPDKAYIASIFEDREKRLWLATFGDGLYRWSAKEFRQFDKRDGLNGTTFNRIIEDKNGTIWIGGLEGLQRLVGDRMESFTAADGLTTNFVRDLMQDAQGSLWVGTDRGLDRFRDGRITMWGPRRGLADEFVRTVIEDRNSNIWIGTADGLFRFIPGPAGKGAGAKPTYKVARYGREQGLANAAILSLEEANDGAIWVGTNAGGLYRLRAAANYAAENVATKMAMGAGSVRALVSAQDGSLWVGTSAGLFRWRQNAPPQRFATGEGLPSEQILALHEDGRKVLWVGTRQGIARIENGAVLPAVPGYAFDGNVFAFSPDSTGVLWVATARGLAMIQGTELRFFSSAEGVPARSLFNVLDDRQGSLWMCSNKGLVRVTKTALREIASGARPLGAAELLGRSDGMATVQCNGGSGPSSWLGKDGQLMFATARGLAVVDATRAVPFSVVPPPVFVREMEIDGATRPVTNAMTLPPGEHRIEIRYVGLNLADPDRVRFRYRLQGFDDRWINAGADQRAIYTNVPPGSYRFQVSASNQEGAWGEPPTTVELNVSTFFFNTLPFRVGVIAALLLAAFLLYRMRVAALKKRAVTLKAQVEERTRDLAEQTQRLRLADDEKAKLLQRVEAQARSFEALSKEDALTGLANRREMDRFLAVEVDRARRNDRPLCVAMADLDYFKQINDRFSHTVGDEVLRLVSRIFSKSCRSIDMAARFGGEELVLVLPETRLPQAEMLCERLRDAVEHYDWAQIHPELKVTISVGVVAVDADATAESMLNAADQRLYAAKRAGRNRVMI
jgi:diguanylate cyclase (GGDEF)-like protein